MQLGGSRWQVISLTSYVSRRAIDICNSHLRTFASNAGEATAKPLPISAGVAHHGCSTAPRDPTRTHCGRTRRSREGVWWTSGLSSKVWRRGAQPQTQQWRFKSTDSTTSNGGPYVPVPQLRIVSTILVHVSLILQSLHVLTP